MSCLLIVVLQVMKEYSKKKINKQKHKHLMYFVLIILILKLTNIDKSICVEPQLCHKSTNQCPFPLKS